MKANSLFKNMLLGAAVLLGVSVNADTRLKSVEELQSGVRQVSKYLKSSPQASRLFEAIAGHQLGNALLRVTDETKIMHDSVLFKIRVANTLEEMVKDAENVEQINAVWALTEDLKKVAGLVAESDGKVSIAHVKMNMRNLNFASVDVIMGATVTRDAAPANLPSSEGLRLAQLTTDFFDKFQTVSGGDFMQVLTEARIKLASASNIEGAPTVATPSQELSDQALISRFLNSPFYSRWIEGVKAEACLVNMGDFDEPGVESPVATYVLAAALFYDEFVQAGSNVQAQEAVANRALNFPIEAMYSIHGIARANGCMAFQSDACPIFQMGTTCQNLGAGSGFQAVVTDR